MIFFVGGGRVNRTVLDVEQLILKVFVLPVPPPKKSINIIRYSVLYPKKYSSTDKRQKQRDMEEVRQLPQSKTS